jgi:hypothetical protein
MRTPASRTIASRTRTRGLWLLALAVVVLALVLTACAGRAARNGGTAPANSSHSSGAQQSSGQDFSSDDQAIQSLMQQLDSASNDANTDYSSQDNPVQP